MAFRQTFSHHDPMGPLHYPSYPHNSGISDMIDPSIKSQGCSGQPVLLSDQGKFIYPGYGNYDPMPFIGIPPLPSAQLARQGSPSEHQSSVCSSAMSPPEESDCGIEHLPNTPQDELSLSPYNHSQEYWGSQATPFFDLAGLTTDCVKPGDVSIYPDYSSYGNDRNPHFQGRGYSMSSHGTSCDAEPFGHPDAFTIQRQMSPVELGQEIIDAIEVYPEAELERNHQPAGGEDDGSSILVAYQEHEENGDEDYKPPKPRRASATTSRGRVKDRKRPSTALAPEPSKKVKLERASSNGRSATAMKHTLQSARSSFACAECSDVSFSDENGLQKHMKSLHNRPFVCIFEFAGCRSTFASKNEWKRHVSSQHLLLRYWLCDLEGCAKAPGSSSTPAPGGVRGHPKSRQPPVGPADQQLGAVFNRKDLYTQHLRRMHVPPGLRKQVKQNKTVPEWESRIRAHQDKAQRLRCELPTYMTCPAKGCDCVFSSAQAWDERMEHVARHLEKAATGAEPPVVFGGEHDPTLTEWAARPDVAVVVPCESRGWKLAPVRQGRGGKGQGQSSRAPSKRDAESGDDDEEQDADGEVIDE